MTVNVNCQEALEILRRNRENHGDIVKEAREGYLKEAERVMRAKLAELSSGLVVELTFELRPPQDYTRVYDTTIRMLELHQGETLELDGNQVRHLLMDEWDWMEHFLMTNCGLSPKAQEYATSKGIG
jgi:hypothetical protein